MFSNTLSLLSPRNASDQVSHPYKTTGEIIVLYINKRHRFSKMRTLWQYSGANRAGK
jgi:hypothetical protein